MKELSSYSTAFLKNMPTSEDPPVNAKEQESVEAIWKKLGSKFVLFSHPLYFSSRRLVVLVQSSAWITTIRHQIPRLTQHFNENNIEINRIEIKVQPSGLYLSRTNRRKVSLSIENGRQLESLSERVNHPELKRSLLNLAQRAKTK